MRLHDLTLETPELNLALDEALLLDPAAGETLRLWESRRPAVVLGRSSRHADETDPAACVELGTPVLRRVSGGAAIVTGPGCLMYAVTLDVERRPELADLTKAHRFVLGRLVEALQALEPSVAIGGTSDLSVRRDDGLRKFSGNSLRRVRNRLLYHGTLLYGFDLSLVPRLLRFAPRQPDYRAGRDHGAFITNLTAERSQIAARLAQVWSAAEAPCYQSTLDRAGSLVDEKYALPEWNRSR